MIQWKINENRDRDPDMDRGTVCFSAGTYYGSMRDTGAYALFVQANELASKGVRAASVEVQIAIPPDMDKARINSFRNHIKRAAKRLSEEGFAVRGLQIQGGIQRAVRLPAVQVMAAGAATGANIGGGGAACRDILLVGWIGIEGMLRAIGERESELRERFTPAFIRQMKGYDGEVLGLRKIDAAERIGISVIRQITEGGILAALWRLSEETGLGMELDMKKFAVKQETIEVCEYFRLNPYQLTSGGSFLMLAEHGGTAAEEFRRKGIAAEVIGRLTDRNDKVIRNGEDIRYIDRAGADELMKVWSEREPGATGIDMRGNL